MVDLYLLPMDGTDIMVVIQWLKQLGKITTDYGDLFMEFHGQELTGWTTVR